MRRALRRIVLAAAVILTCCPSPHPAKGDGHQPAPQPGADESPARPNGDLAGVYAIVCVNNLRCLDAPATAAGVNGTRPQLWRPNRQDNQRWEIRPVSGNRVKIVCAASGKVLDLEATQLRKHRAAVQLYDDLNGQNQLWELVPHGGGVFTIRNCACDKVLDADGGEVERDGCPVQAFGDLDGDNQRWVLLKYLGVSPSLSVSDVVVEKDTQAVEQSCELADLTPGVKATFERSKTVEHVVDVKLHEGSEQSLDTRVRGAWFAVEAEVKAAVKVKAEAATGRSWRVAETRRQTIEVDADKVRSAKVKIAWVEQRRRGRARVSLGGDSYDVEFHFPERVDLVVKPVDDGKEK
jgi:hypothetical protein